MARLGKEQGTVGRGIARSDEELGIAWTGAARNGKAGRSEDIINRKQ